MGLFDSKEENIKKSLDKKGLSELNNLSPNDMVALENIMGYMDLANANSVGTAIKTSEIRAQIMFSQAIAHQNLMIIKQLDRLNKNIEKLVNK